MNKINLTIEELPYAAEEALNRLRVNIKFCGKNTKKILITSSAPDEGKSTVSSHLWKMLAEAGFPTVYVDCDLRKSVVKNRLHISGIQAGLDYYLSGQAEYEDVVYETNYENGYWVPVSNILENPSALLEDPRTEELLDRLSRDYRFVILDTPPLGAVSDGALLASLCDGAVLVVRCGETPKGVIRQSLQQLRQVNCPVLGTVLNRAEVKGGIYRKRYSKYGQYYYGDGEKDRVTR
ncbi:MAG: CpsD/CapB family tyrosine-protein kinase [Eubacterium sp.]|nr:CpsD/CapB family tyrosine-protein kinase [Eubacterium sp.]MDD7209332.1 CpsD/CapB family tyrosine-protein kinase [Lachnospiraceae bacterium]MDY5496645.1 CpsD/CapB family tyrosine-protein kinase [Anaerobutyricum sp.]